jgi:hypothetical protein
MWCPVDRLDHLVHLGRRSPERASIVATSRGSRTLFILLGARPRIIDAALGRSTSARFSCLARGLRRGACRRRAGCVLRQLEHRVPAVRPELSSHDVVVMDRVDVRSLADADIDG